MQGSLGGGGLVSVSSLRDGNQLSPGAHMTRPRHLTGKLPIPLEPLPDLPSDLLVGLPVLHPLGKNCPDDAARLFVNSINQCGKFPRCPCHSLRVSHVEYFPYKV